MNQIDKQAVTIENYRRAARLIYNNYGLNRVFDSVDLCNKLEQANLSRSYLKWFADGGVLKQPNRGCYVMVEYKTDTHMKAYFAMQRYYNTNKDRIIHSQQPELELKVNAEDKPKRTRRTRKRSFIGRLKAAWKAFVK